MVAVTFNGEAQTSLSLEGEVGFYFWSQGATLELDEQKDADGLVSLRDNWRRAKDGNCSLLVEDDGHGHLSVNGTKAKMYEYFVKRGVDPVSALNIILK